MTRPMTPAALNALLSGDMYNYVVATTEGSIEAQERAGGEQFRQSDMLPKDCRNCTRTQLEAIGIIFGGEVDDLFVEATLPEGWQKITIDLSRGLWTNVVDIKGRVRAHVFYKAA